MHANHVRYSVSVALYLQQTALKVIFAQLVINFSEWQTVVLQLVPRDIMPIPQHDTVRCVQEVVLSAKLVISITVNSVNKITVLVSTTTNKYTWIPVLQTV